jgi:hypothetical protein
MIEALGEAEEAPFVVWKGPGVPTAIWRGLAKNNREAKKKAMAENPGVDGKKLKVTRDTSVPMDKIPKSGPK